MKLAIVAAILASLALTGCEGERLNREKHSCTAIAEDTRLWLDKTQDGYTEDQLRAFIRKERDLENIDERRRYFYIMKESRTEAAWGRAEYSKDPIAFLERKCFHYAPELLPDLTR